MAEEMANRYNPAEFEERVYSEWERSGKFRAGAGKGKDPFTIVIPPPNVTGVLHMGHGLNNTIQDILIRYQRMNGRATLWLPGTDHAGIATQNVVEKKLAKEGRKRQDLGREAFVDEVWKWKHEHGSTIINQLKKLGASCDWERERFTMDEGLSKAVREVFVRLHEKGLIYRGEYIINWCPRCGTALADEEAEHKEIGGTFTFIRYPFADAMAAAPEGTSPEDIDGVVVATTRPETMLGDTAVAVHPDDERFAGMIGRQLVLPLTGRTIPLIADTAVDREFGTGAVKITPAHDPNDFETGNRHGLPRINVLNEDGTINANAPEKYRGMDRFACRKMVLSDLETGGFFVKQDKIKHAVGHCYRCDTVVEPYLSKQWFVKMAPLAGPAIRAVEEGKITFHTERWKKVYLNWMTNIRDWCISRQIWWGHQVPAWYAVSETGGRVTRETPVYVARSEAEARAQAVAAHGEGVVLQQDPDVLDTWFSSWLWPFSTLGWPEKTPDLAFFYPTSVLVTDMGIIFFWVARMIMAGYFCMGELPFRDVYIHGTVMDDKGRKMSKSLGNGIDPLDVIREYGADALRYTMVAITPQGQNTLLSMEKFQIGSRLANKIWNASRYILMNVEGRTWPLPPVENRTFEDRWILSRLQRTADSVRAAMAEFRLNDVATGIAHFFRDDFCDWYIEFTKQRLYGEDEAAKAAARGVLLHVLEAALRLMHPVMPFITEEIRQRLPGVDGSIMDTHYPESDISLIDDEAEGRMGAIQAIVSGVRNVRAEMHIPPEKAVEAVIHAASPETAALVESMRANIISQARLETLTAGTDAVRPPLSASVVGAGWEVWIPLEGMIDIAAERARLEKEQERLSQEVARVKGKLGNQGFVANAPEEVIAAERAKLASWEERLARLAAGLADLAG